MAKKFVVGHIRKIKTTPDYTKVFLGENIPTDGLSCGLAMFPPGHESRMHHHAVEEGFLVLSGYGCATDGAGNKYELEPGSFLYVPAKGEHNLKNTSDMPLMFVFIITKPKFKSVYEDEE